MQKQKRIRQSDSVTENYLDKRFSQERIYIDGKIAALMRYIDFKIEPLESLKDRFDDLESKIFDRLDWLIGEYKKLAEEQMIINQHHSDMLQALNIHEVRITKLENHIEPR